MHGKHVLNRAGFLHQLIHLILVHIAKTRIYVIHLIFHIIKEIKCRGENGADSHALFKRCVLVEITHTHLLGPLYLALIRHKSACDNIHKSRFSLTVCTDKPYVLALQQSEGNILKNSTVAKTMA